MSKMELKAELKSFSSDFPSKNARRFLELLKSENAFERGHLPGHFTASGFVFSPDQKKIALVYHRKLGRWLQPGGHADGDSDLLHVAKKEIEEEIGICELRPLRLSPHFQMVDLDIHGIPAGRDPAHDHYDVRYAFIALEEVLKCSEESLEVKWWDLNQAIQLVGESSFTSTLQLLVEKVLGTRTGGPHKRKVVHLESIWAVGEKMPEVEL